MSVSQTAPDQVRCHSGYTYAQRPVGFTFAGRVYTVVNIVAENRLPDGRQFLVQTRDGIFFDLIYTESNDCWQVRISDRGKSITQGAGPKNHAG